MVGYGFSRIQVDLSSSFFFFESSFNEREKFFFPAINSSFSVSGDDDRYSTQSFCRKFSECESNSDFEFASIGKCACVCVCVRGANFKRVAFCRGVRYPLNRLLSSLAHAFACLFIHLAPPSADSPARSSTRSFAPLRVTRSTKARARVFSSGLLLLPPSLLGRNQGDQIRGGESRARLSRFSLRPPRISRVQRFLRPLFSARNNGGASR